jgi:N-acetylmuramic acid 6-phosphate etherase
MKKNDLFQELSTLVTESRNPRSVDIDIMNTEEIIRLINSEDKIVADIVKGEIPYIIQAVEIVTAAFKNGGRLIYAGAGTSGRMGVLDAAECPPTFGVSAEMVQGIIAGGYGALVKAVEGAEDFEENGSEAIKNRHITDKDVVCGIAASRRTPYVIGALKEAKRAGAKTLMVVCNPREDITVDVDVAICPVVGAEVVTGSTRMKSATAQKMVLNILTTTAMIKLGKVYENMMIDLQQNNQKLVERSKKIIMIAANVSYADAAKYLEEAGGHVKSAILMALTGLKLEKVKNLLSKNDGFIKRALFSWKKNQSG